VAGAHKQRLKFQAHESFLRHGRLRWLKIGVALCVWAVAAYLLADVHPRPSGGTWLGYVLGTVGAALIVWLALLGVRKRVVTTGHYSLKAWVSAHVYLGLSLTVIVTLHTGFQFGWNVHTLAYALMMLVIVSGGFGVWAYVALPARLSENRGETTRKQMLETLTTLDGQLHDAAQPLSAANAAIVRLSLEETEIGGGFWTRLTGRYAHCATTRAIARTAVARRAATGVEAPALDTIAALLDRKAEALALARRQMRITALLEAWLFVHIPATFALLAALTAHIVSVFFYW
jgi:hypothetical protein